ncbi:hypothetical protein GPJ59_27110 [Streptomyces bambusae]|uniref:DUF4190 domain-containing protein n=2 Tax=Streptomyces bambusae TaxID=1550616 RepID=A0ABS6ZCE9_9ACTN|nr:hypothetical protein [Streptomyces bambusae]
MPGAHASSNGLAVSALVVGCIGLAVAFVPFLFWIGGIMAVVALGLGIGAVVRASKGGGRRAMAVTGTVLGVLGIGACVAGWFITASVVDRLADRADRSLGRELDEIEELERSFPSTPAKPTKPSPSQVPGLASPVAFGETVTVEDGIKVSLSKPVKYKPETAYGRSKVKNAVTLTATITNTSDKPHEVIYAVPNVRDEKGMTAELVFDTTVPKMIKGSIAPGQSASGVFAWEVPEGTTSISADIAAGTFLPPAMFSGPIG